jgi:hypothetical protein
MTTTLRNVKIINCKGPKDDITKSFHVFVEQEGGALLDLSIYDSTELVKQLEQRGLPCGPEFYDEEKYNKLVSFAKNKLNSRVDVDVVNYVIIGIRDADPVLLEAVPAASAAAVNYIHRITQNSGKIVLLGRRSADLLLAYC